MVTTFCNLIAPPIVAFDEFTSVVDRNVAQIGSAAIAKSDSRRVVELPIRGGDVSLRRRRVARARLGRSTWPGGRVSGGAASAAGHRAGRPYRTKHALWRLFAPHHYLSGALNRARAMLRRLVAQQPGGVLRDTAGYRPQEPLAHHAHRDAARLSRRRHRHAHGRGSVCELHRQQGHQITVTASHPSLVAHCRRSPLWRTARGVEVGLGAHRRLHSQLSRFDGASRRFVRILGSGQRGRLMEQSRRGILDELKQREICAILAIGCTRELAGALRRPASHPTTIRRTALRDAEFAAALEQAETTHEIAHMTHINAAAKEGRYWRAAAWALERKYPDRYAPRDPRTFTIDQIGQVLGAIRGSDSGGSFEGSSQRKRILARLTELTAGLQASAGEGTEA